MENEEKRIKNGNLYLVQGKNCNGAYITPHLSEVILALEQDNYVFELSNLKQIEKGEITLKEAEKT